MVFFLSILIYLEKKREVIIMSTELKKYCTISVGLYMDMRHEIADLNTKLRKEKDNRLILEDKIKSLEEQNGKLTRIIDAIM